MKILSDESVPVQVRFALPTHQVLTVSGLDWKGLENGDVLTAARRDGFDLLIVADKNLRYQQNLSANRIAIAELWTNHRPTLELYFSHIEKAVSRAIAGTYVIVSPP